MDLLTQLEQIIEPALNEYGIEIGRHGQATYVVESARCDCGWAPGAHVSPRQRRRAVGLHIGAAMRRADIQFTRRAAELRAKAAA